MGNGELLSYALGEYQRGEITADSKWRSTRWCRIGAALGGRWARDRRRTGAVKLGRHWPVLSAVPTVRQRLHLHAQLFSAIGACSVSMSVFMQLSGNVLYDCGQSWIEAVA